MKSEEIKQTLKNIINRLYPHRFCALTGLVLLLGGGISLTFLNINLMGLNGKQLELASSLNNCQNFSKNCEEQISYLEKLTDENTIEDSILITPEPTPTRARLSDNKNIDSISKLDSPSVYARILEIITDYYDEMIFSDRNISNMSIAERGEEWGYFIVRALEINLPELNEKIYFDENGNIKAKLFMPNFNRGADEEFIL